jgi:hypothetical protein
MGCTGECPSDCECNADCVGNVGPCPNNGKSGTGWDTVIAAGTIITADHLAELETAINDERTNVNRTSRCLGTLNACGSNCPGAFNFAAGGSRGSGDIIDADHFSNVAAAINSTPYNKTGATEGPEPDAITPTPYVNQGETITAQHVLDLRSAIETVEQNCICNAYLEVVCTCHPLCDTDGDPY